MNEARDHATLVELGRDRADDRCWCEAGGELEWTCDEFCEGLLERTIRGAFDDRAELDEAEVAVHRLRRSDRHALRAIE